MPVEEYINIFPADNSQRIAEALEEISETLQVLVAYYVNVTEEEDDTTRQKTPRV